MYTAPLLLFYALSLQCCCPAFYFSPLYEKRIWMKRNSDFTACHLFLFPHLPACLAETPNSERPDRLFHPGPQASGMTSSLCYLAPDIKLLVPIAAALFFSSARALRAGYVLLPVTPTAPTLLLRLENLPALSFIYHNPYKRAGSWGECGEVGTSFILISTER